MSIGTICYPALSPKLTESNAAPREVAPSSALESFFDSRDTAIYCLSGALILVVIALIVVLASR